MSELTKTLFKLGVILFFPSPPPVWYFGRKSVFLGDDNTFSVPGGHPWPPAQLAASAWLPCVWTWPAHWKGTLTGQWVGGKSSKGRGVRCNFSRLFWILGCSQVSEALQRQIGQVEPEMNSGAAANWNFWEPSSYDSSWHLLLAA